MTKQEIEALGDDELIEGLRLRIQERLDRTVELAHFVSELHRRGLDVSGIETTRLNRYIAISNGNLVPELYERFANSQWIRIFEKYDVETQSRVMTGRFKVAAVEGRNKNKSMTFDEMTYPQQQQVFGLSGPRDIAAQNEWLDRKAFGSGHGKDTSGLLVSVRKVIGRWEGMIDDLSDDDREAMLEMIVNFARNLGFDPAESRPVPAHPEDQERVAEYLLLHGAARSRVIAADLGIEPNRVKEVLETGYFVHNGEGYYAVNEKRQKVSS